MYDKPLKAIEVFSQIMKSLLLRAIKIYRLYLSQWLNRSCRFYPSCSAYALEAVEKYGALGGCIRAINRLLRCHPFNSGGYDPVPDQRPLLFKPGKNIEPFAITYFGEESS